MNTCKNKGFTLIEILIVIAIVTSLSAIGGGIFLKYANDAKKLETQTLLRGMTAAIENMYQSTYQLPYNNGANDAKVPTENTIFNNSNGLATILNILAANGDNKSLNTQKTTYLKLPERRDGKAGVVIKNGLITKFLDSWGNDILLQINYKNPRDATIVANTNGVTGYTQPIYGKNYALAISPGKDKTIDNTDSKNNDDILSYD